MTVWGGHPRKDHDGKVLPKVQQLKQVQRTRDLTASLMGTITHENIGKNYWRCFTMLLSTQLSTPFVLCKDTHKKYAT